MEIIKEIESVTVTIKHEDKLIYTGSEIKKVVNELYFGEWKLKTFVRSEELIQFIYMEI